MEADTPTNPFTPGTALKPVMLAGREAETAILQNAIDLLLKPRISPGGPLRQAPYTPIRLVGPRGSGKTTLLNWAKSQAEDKGIRVVTWERLKEDGGPESSLHDLMFSLAGGEDSFLERFKHVGFGLMDKVTFGVSLQKAGRNYERVMARALEDKPLLLLLDEVQHYDINPLATVIQKNQALLGASQPLAMVLAGTPGLETLLRKAEASFIFRSKKIVFSKLTPAETRKALMAPFEKYKIAVPHEALEAMALQTDEYPYFIQLIGRAVWDAMEQAGRKDIDVELVAQATEKAREEREEFYWENYCAMRERGIMPYARQVMNMLSQNGGKMSTNALIDSLVKHNSNMDEAKAQRVCNELWEEGFIWINRHETEAGIPSFFSYFEAKDK